MEKLDRLGWTAGISLKAYGVKVGVRTNHPSILPALPDHFPPGWQPSEEKVVDLLFSLRVAPATGKGRRNYHLLYANAGLVARSTYIEEVLERLESSMQLLVAYGAQDDLLFVHAGVVGWHGRAVLIPGRTHSGKTTLVAALLRAGATYYSDEFAVLDEEGRVHPYPKALAIRTTDGQCKTSPTVFGADVGEDALPVGLIADTQYSHGASWRPRRLSPGRALLVLLNNTVAARRHPEVYMPILRRVALQAPAIRSKRGEADAIAASILGRLESQRKKAAEYANLEFTKLSK